MDRNSVYDNKLSLTSYDKSNSHWYSSLTQNRQEDIPIKPKYKGVYNRFVKRILDICLSFVLILLLLPAFILLTLVIVIDSGFPVFYRAQRGGYRGRTFRIFKFRSMVKNADKIGGGTTALNDCRITKVGQFLRKTKLDEIPQVLNIFVGQMSFVGPRPELLKYTQAYCHEEKEILKVRPGITDYSSIRFISLDEIVGGEDAEEMYEKYVLKEKNLLRIQYAKEVSLKTDTKIFFITVGKTIEKAFKFIVRK